MVSVPSTPGVVIPPTVVPVPVEVQVNPTGHTTVPGVPATGVPDALLRAAREIGPKYPTAGEIPVADCHAARADRVCAPKYPVAPAGIEYPLLMRTAWKKHRCSCYPLLDLC